MINSLKNLLPPIPQISFYSRATSLISSIALPIFGPPSAYLLKIAFFQTVPKTDCFSRYIMGPLARTIVNLWQRTQGIQGARTGFDPNRLQKSRDLLSQFADWKTLELENGQTVDWALFRADRFNAWIDEIGGKREGERIIPKTPQDWPSLQSQFSQLKWFKEEGQSFKVLLPSPNAERNCILRCQGFGRQMPMDKAFIALHLAAGFNYALFDWGDEMSLPTLCSRGEAVYQALLKEGFTPKTIKAMGSCRATFVVSHLKKEHHHQGMDAVLIHPPPSLYEVVETQNWLARKVGQIGVSWLEAQGSRFDNLENIREMGRGDAGLCVVLSEGDQTLPADTRQKIERAAQEALCPLDLIWDPAQEGGPDAHFGEPLENPLILEQYLRFLARE